MGSFTQYYGSDGLDASLLMIPLVGFLPATDPRMRGTIEAIERDLLEGDFVLRYRTVDSGEVDGLSGREGAFLACSFWLADCLALLGRDADARRLLERLLDLRNDLGLLSEEYDPVAGRLVGNFPQAFSHVSLVNSAAKVTGHVKPSSEHVFLGLARQAMSGGRPTGAVRRHMSVSSAGTVMRDLVGRVDQGPMAATGGVARSRPTKRRSVQREVPRKKPGKTAAVAGEEVGPEPQDMPTRAAARKGAAAKKASAAKKATAKKASAAKKATAKKASAAKKATAKKATAVKKTTAKKATSPTKQPPASSSPTRTRATATRPAPSAPLP